MMVASKAKDYQLLGSVLEKVGILKERSESEVDRA